MRADGGQIRLRPIGLVPEDLRNAIRGAKAEILALLGVPPATADAPASTDNGCNECGSQSWTVALVDETGHRVCHDCITGMTALRANGVPI